MSITRHQIREVAFQALFSLNSTPDTDVMTVVDNLLEEKRVSKCTDYLRELVQGVLSHQAELDDEIALKLNSKWTLSRLPKTDLIILRLGLYEIQNCDEIPNKVALNEALQLAKEFSDEKQRGFINGVLSNFI